MIMQDRPKRTMFYHDLGKDAKINHVLDKDSIVANPFFGNSYFLILFILLHRFLVHSRTSLKNQQVTSIGEVLAKLTNHS